MSEKDMTERSQKEERDAHLKAFSFFRSEVEKQLQDSFSGLIRYAGQVDSSTEELVAQLRDFTLRGGKRFRALLLFAAAKSSSQDSKDSLLLDGPLQKAGAALEMLQSYLLVHDDWMDQDEERRGGPSLHVAFAQGKLGCDQHSANSLAILAGDLASTVAWELMVEASSLSPGALKDFYEMQREVICGQTLDVLHHEDATLVSRLKTTSYTVLGPLMVGASLAQSRKDVRACLKAFATPIGEAFQLRDDLLGTFGDLANTGKPGDDLLHGKRNGVTEVAYEMLNDAQKKELEIYLEHAGEGMSDLRVQEAERFKVMFKNAGVQEALEKQIDSLYEKSMLALKPNILAEQGMALLKELAHKMAYRNK